MLENKLERACFDEAMKQQCILLKIERRLGWPDRQLLAPNGQITWIEFKAPGEKPRKIQLHIHQMLRGMNFRVEVIDNFSLFQSVLMYLKGLPPLTGYPNHTSSVELNG